MSGVFGGMASSGTRPPSIRHGARIVPPDNNVTVEEVLLAVGEQVGHEKLIFASRMNKAVVVFLKEEPLVHSLIGRGVFMREMFVQVSPLSVPSTRITVSGVPPFIPNELLEKELRRFGKFASAFKTVSLGCRDPKLKHVQSLRRQVFMFLDAPDQTLDVSFRVKHDDSSYMVYASAGHMKCFECGDVGHKRFACPHKQQAAGADGAPEDGAGAPTEAPAVAGPGAPVAAPTVASSAELEAEHVENNVDEEEQGNNVSVAADVSNSQSEAAVDGIQVAGSVEAAGAAGSDGQDAESSQVSVEGEEMEDDSESDSVSISDASIRNTDTYSAEEINHFLDVTYKRSIKVSDYFSDTEKCIRSVGLLKRQVGFDILDEKKRFRLKKHITTLRKEAKNKTVKTRRK